MMKIIEICIINVLRKGDEEKYRGKLSNQSSTIGISYDNESEPDKIPMKFDADDNVNEINLYDSCSVAIL